jgi:Arc/MetJ-type ribon-helix-helix transcriptional regulator
MAQTEKITINLGAVDLGRIDLLVEEGFYSNRSDFIRTAIRNQLDTHADVVKQAVVRQDISIGAVTYTRSGLESLQQKGERVSAIVVGLVHIAKDVTPELARATIQSLKVYGVLRASPQVKKALADRT